MVNLQADLDSPDPFDKCVAREEKSNKGAQHQHVGSYEGTTQKEKLTSKIQRSKNSLEFEVEKQLVAEVQSLTECENRNFNFIREINISQMSLLSHLYKCTT